MKISLVVSYVCACVFLCARLPSFFVAHFPYIPFNQHKCRMFNKQIQPNERMISDMNVLFHNTVSFSLSTESFVKSEHTQIFASLLLLQSIYTTFIHFIFYPHLVLSTSFFSDWQYFLIAGNVCQHLCSFLIIRLFFMVLPRFT